MADVKWSSWTVQSAPTTGNTLVGLSGGVNVQFGLTGTWPINISGLAAAASAIDGLAANTLYGNASGTGPAPGGVITLGTGLAFSGSQLVNTAPSPTPAALTQVSDTNVTLTLGGTPASALLAATSITAGWSGLLSGTRGGTGVNNGASTFTIGGNTAFSGAFTFAGTLTANTAVTFPTSGTLATTAQLPTPAALTAGNDTNITLTLAGTPATALLQAASVTAGWAGTLALTRGGLGANLTASNGGIFYSTASSGAILAGTATAGQLLTSGASTTPAWTTSTYPLTNAINTLLYASSANTMAALATANSGVLVTSAGGVPSISTTLPSGIAATNMALTTPAITTGLTLNSGTQLDTYSAGTWVPVPTGLTIVGTPTYTGTYVKIGAIVFCQLHVTSTTSTASAYPSTYFSGLPYPAAQAAPAIAFEGTTLVQYGTGAVEPNGGTPIVYTPAWAANADTLVTFTYQATTN